MNENAQALKSELIGDITHYMQFGGAEDESDPDFDPSFDAGYTQEHIDRCSRILDEFLGELEQAKGAARDQHIMSVVKTAVLALNEVNGDSDGCMIETDQREQLCEIIISAAREAGLVSSQHDITEEWRDW